MYSVTKIVTLIKSITAHEIFKRFPEVKYILWGGEFWTDGYLASSVGKHDDENMIGRYVKNQGKEHKTLHSNYQITLLYNTQLLAAEPLLSHYVVKVNSHHMTTLALLFYTCFLVSIHNSGSAGVLATDQLNTGYLNPLEDYSTKCRQ
ncbi:transposase [Citrobacter youngae]|uniref:transposase n=1 Tax=Citrobacter youngae TaxID=133448 RepID=UPI003EE055C0